VVDAVTDLGGAVAIPAHSPAKLLILSESGGGAGSPYLYLDLDSVTLGGKVHRVYTAELKEASGTGFGKNKRTAEFLGGGAAMAVCWAPFLAVARERRLGQPRAPGADSFRNSSPGASR
jgi:hypothetical protein